MSTRRRLRRRPSPLPRLARREPPRRGRGPARVGSRPSRDRLPCRLQRRLDSPPPRRLRGRRLHPPRRRLTRGEVETESEGARTAYPHRVDGGLAATRVEAATGCSVTTRHDYQLRVRSPDHAGPSATHGLLKPSARRPALVARRALALRVHQPPVDVEQALVLHVPEHPVDPPDARRHVAHVVDVEPVGIARRSRNASIRSKWRVPSGAQAFVARVQTLSLPDFTKAGNRRLRALRAHTAPRGPGSCTGGDDPAGSRGHGRESSSNGVADVVVGRARRVTMQRCPWRR